MRENVVRSSTARGWLVVVSALSGAASLGGCALGMPLEPGRPALPAPPVPSLPPMTTASEPQSAGSAAPTRAALADAARRTGLPAAQIMLLSAERVIWSDGSLGCPQPGMMYTQALVPGLRIRIRAGTESLDYHASERGALVLCPPGRAVDPMPASGRV